MYILNLPDWEVIDLKESEYDYAIHARYTPEPTACIRCGVIGQLYRHGIKRQRFMDLPVHNKRVGLIVHRQRYHCLACKKTSFQPLPDMVVLNERYPSSAEKPLFHLTALVRVGRLNRTN